MVWDRKRILATLADLHKKGEDLSYNGLAKRHQSLVSAAAYHFGSYRHAVERAGIDYAEVTRRPRWSKATIIRQIKQARRAGEDLHWSAVTRRRDELGRAAFAALQPRLFGSWDRALHAAGLDADDINRYRKWDRNSIVTELKSRAQNGDALNSGAIQRDDPGLHAAAVRHFSTYDLALRAARIDPAKVRRRKAWTPDEVVKKLRAAYRSGQRLSDSHIRKIDPALYGAAVRLFGTFTAARAASNVDPTARKPTTGRATKSKKRQP